jgi:Tfp pilus assembly protein PilV
MRRRNEDGITLTELLLAMVITAIIMVPIAGSVYTTVHTVAPTQNRIDESNGADLLASYFSADVQNAVTVDVAIGATLANESTTTCGASARPVDLLLTTAADGTTSVSYYRGTTATDSNVLYRRTCAVVGGAGTASPAVRVLHFLSGAPQFTVQSDPVTGAWQSVTGTVSQSDPRFTGSTYATTVQGTRRVS